MKKIISVKEIMVVLISITIITLSTTVFASGLVLGNNVTTITGNEYENAQTVPQDNNIVNNVGNNTVNNTVNNSVNNTTNKNVANNKVNNTKVYNTNNTDLPQTGIEDYNIGILLIICIASAIFAYRKISDYRNI